MADKKKITSFTATVEELEVIDALADEFGVSRSSVIVMACYFFESLRFQVRKAGGEGKVIELREIVKKRNGARGKKTVDGSSKGMLQGVPINKNRECF
jgi:ribosomal protein L18E